MLSGCQNQSRYQHPYVAGGCSHVGRFLFDNILKVMTDYYGNHFSLITSRSNFAEAQTSLDVAEITEPPRGVCDGDRQYDRLLDAIPDIVWTANAGGSATYFSQRWEDYTGIPVAAALDFGYLARVHPDDRDRLIVAAPAPTTADYPAKRHGWTHF